MRKGSRPLDETLRHDLTDVQNCIDNANRLKSDSTHLVSAPTRALLLELALEELGKGAALCLRLFVHRKSEGKVELTARGEALKAALMGIATDHEVTLLRDAYDIGGFVSDFDLDALFRDHPPKLQAISRLAKIARTSLRVAKAHPKEFLEAVETDPKLKRQLGHLAHLSESDVTAFGEVRQTEYLSGLRERATYVNVDDRRRFTVPPTVDAEELRRLARSYKVASAMVQSWLFFYREFIAG